MSFKISDLPTHAHATTASNDIVFMVSDLKEKQSAKMSIADIVKSVKNELGCVDNPLVKCRHCGQWGAVYCACKHCGAPIDPQEAG